MASIGNQYVLGLKAVNCRMARFSMRSRSQAARKEEVLNALTMIASNVPFPRRRIAQHDTRAQHSARTGHHFFPWTLFRTYTAGLSIMGQGHFRAAIPLFERAIAIDPNFAMAYYLRGIAYKQAGDMERSAEDAKRAFSLVDHVSETERTDITRLSITGSRVSWIKRSTPSNCLPATIPAIGVPTTS